MSYVHAQTEAGSVGAQEISEGIIRLQACPHSSVNKRNMALSCFLPFGFAGPGCSRAGPLSYTCRPGGAALIVGEVGKVISPKHRGQAVQQRIYTGPQGSRSTNYDCVISVHRGDQHATTLLS